MPTVWIQISMRIWPEGNDVRWFVYQSFIDLSAESVVPKSEVQADLRATLSAYGMWQILPVAG